MFHNALVGVDGRQGGRDAVALASALVGRGAKITLLHVHDGLSRLTHAATPGTDAQEREKASRLLEQESTAAGISAELVEVESPRPGRVLHEQAEEHAADLIVVGSCRHSAVGRAMLGNDTRAALNGAPCAIAVASLGFQARPALSRIGVGYDESAESRAALGAARELGATKGATVTALEVISIPSQAYMGFISPAALADIDEDVRQVNERLSRQLDGIHGRATWGLAGEELAAFGDDLDLLVIGSRGFGPLKRMMLGSTADYLERHARCCLLVLPRVAIGDQLAAAGGA